ncbi:MAG: DinB family protein [Bacteroidia bacterium]|nr:DinB family protein [Bacteroidia bacterium]MCO5254604.1 DinB family protein [Bacteroidota bacterium]MCZ2131393.1 DinB family protein [Bacteroidia bacterium]
MVTLPINECPAYFEMYLKLVDKDILQELNTQLESYSKFINSISKEKELFSYAPGKWTVKEVIGHITDTERIMFHRAFRIARKDTTPLPGFDEDAYVAATDFNDRDMSDLLDEFVWLRKSVISFYKTLKPGDLLHIGTASNKSVSARALFYFLLGHWQHHVNFLKERYL